MGNRLVQCSLRISSGWLHNLVNFWFWKIGDYPLLDLWLRDDWSYLCHPCIIVCLVNFSKAIGVQYLESWTIHDSWSWVSSAWNFLRECFSSIRSVLSVWNGNPRHTIHGLFPPIFAFITAHDDDLDVLSTILIPFIVKIFQGSLEGCATWSPRGCVEYHEEFVASHWIWTSFFSRRVQNNVTELIHKD